ncbi:MAG: CARDB domain-containing protein [Candidatus Thermoplasmatota archaeon]|nr:CARDB domain-containing protein [Candidatus Thermoplasmatota archaeon]
MKSIGFLIILLGFVILFITVPADAEKYSNTEFFLAKSGIGDVYDLTIDEPSEATPKYWKCRDDPNQANTFYPLVSWETNMGGPLELGDSYSYIFWVESTNVQEISFKTTLYIRTQSGFNNISVDEVSKSASFGSFLSENYTLELESSDIDQSIFPDGVPAYTKLGIKLETSVTWAPDTENRTVWVKGAQSDFLSSFTLDIKHVNIEDDDYYFENDRVEAIDEDSLFIKVNVTNALGAENFDTSSAEIAIDGISGGGKFKDTVQLKSKHSYAKYIQGKWWYQEDNGVTSGNYVVKFSLKDNFGNTWTSSMTYYLEVDQYGLEIGFDEGTGSSGQLPKGGKTDYSFKVLNTGNTRDIFMITIDDSNLPSGWEVSLQSDSSFDLQMDQSSYVQVRVEAPVSAKGGSSERVTITVTSSGNENIFEDVSLVTTVRTYGVAFLSIPDRISIDPEELDIDGYYKFKINIRNTGSDKDTFDLGVTTSRSDWTIRAEVQGNDISAVTIEKSQSIAVDIVVRPVNYEDSLGEEVTLLMTADSISPGDGSATVNSKIVVDVPVEKISDLSVSLDDVLINNKPITILQPSDLQEGIPIVIQLTVSNNGGKSTGSFGVTLYEGSRIVDEFVVEQGIGGFGSAPVILNWETPSEGLKTLKVYVDFKQQTDESNSKRGDNTLTLPLTISEKSSSSGKIESSDDALLYGPGFLLTLSVLSLISVIYSRKKE